MRTSRASKYNKCECGIGIASGESNIRNGTVDWRQELVANVPESTHARDKASGTKEAGRTSKSEEKRGRVASGT